MRGMDFFKKNYIWLLLFILGIFIIYNSITYGRSYFADYITYNHLENYYPDVLLEQSIQRYIVIGSILSVFSVFKMKK